MIQYWTETNCKSPFNIWFINKKNIFTFVFLKRTLVILLLSAYLVSTTEFHQLIKLHLLVEHFMEHRQENKDLHLWKFLCMHYAHENTDNDHHDKDMKLPFKSHEDCVNCFMSGYFSIPFQGIILNPIFFGSESFTSYPENFLTSAYLPNIWQPPKNC